MEMPNNSPKTRDFQLENTAAHSEPCDTNHNQDLALISEPEIKMLEQVGELQDKLAAPLSPSDRLTTLEKMASLYGIMSTQFFGKAWQCLTIIQKEGLWRLVKEDGVQKFSGFQEYAQDFWEGIKKRSRATITRQMTMANLLVLQLGVNPDLLGALVEDKPTITGDILQTGTDEYTGKFVGFEDDQRKRVATELGYTEEDKLPDDANLMRQLVERIADVDHGEASKMSARVRNPFNIWFCYNARDDIISLQGNGRDANGKHVEFCYDYRRHGSESLLKKARDYLLTRVRPDVRKPDKKKR
jgi:hypothetical protein